MCHHYVDDELALEEELLEADADDERVEEDLHVDDDPNEEDEPVEPTAPEPAADD